MIGSSWTSKQKEAYYAAFTMERIGDELWLVVLLLCGALTFVALDRFEDTQAVLVVSLIGVGVLEWATRRLLVPWLATTMPGELRASLPSDRFAGPSSPRAPQTYRELWRRWFGRGAVP
jgi:hypothetical protein